MSSMKCPQCGLVNWSTAEACKRCRLPINGADAPDTNTWQESSSGYSGEPVYQWGDHEGYQGASYPQVGPAEAAQKTGIAIASMVVGIVSMMACGLLGLGSITGLVLGIVALVKAKNSPTKYGGQGFAVAGVVLSVISFFYIGIVMSIAIPNFIASYRAANEGSAIATVNSIVAAESRFESMTGPGKFAPLEHLAAAGLIDPKLAKSAKHNYIFEIKVYGDSYEVLATPVKDDDYKGRSFYFSSKEQFIRAAKKGGVAATAYDPPLNQNEAPSYRQTYERQPPPPAYTPAYQN